MQKIIIGVVVAAAILVGIYFYVSAPKGGTREAAPGGTTAPQSGTPPPPAGGTPAVPSSGTGTGTAAEQPVVTLKNFSFSPGALTVAAGTKVVWKNEDLAGHTVTSDGGAFASRILSQGKTFERVFTEKGTFSYHCEPHPFMKGTVIVE